MASPTITKLSTVTKITVPEEIASQGPNRAYCVTPIESIEPHEGAGGGVPSPRKLSEAAVIMADGI